MTLSVNPTLSPFFAPRGVLVVGASQNPTKLGFGLARNLALSNYSGHIHFVSRRGGTLLGSPVYKTIADAPGTADLAVLLIPATAVPDALIECGKNGVKGVIIAAGGFREIGAEGIALEQRCLAIAQEQGMRLIGPNCIGILDTHLPLDTTFLPPPGPPQGDVAFVSHSGAICAAVIDWARGQGFGLSRLVSLGNQVDVQETDVLTAVAADPFTNVITLYLEGISDGRRFVEEASRVVRQKPIIALKVGRFASGQQAVASHTGALAGAESAFDAAFRRAGVIRANTSEELFDWARALAWCPLPNGRRVAILTNAGGPGVTAADALESNGMSLSPLQPETITALEALLPPFASVNNPIDMLASASPEQYGAGLQLLLADETVDSVLIILPPPPMYATGAVARAIIPYIYAAEKPVIVAVMGERMIQEAVEHFRAAHVPEYRFPERAASALAVLSQRAEYLDSHQSEPIAPADVDKAAVAQILAAEPEGDFITQDGMMGMLAAYGIPTPPLELATTATQAVEIARAMGYPVALKVASPAITHKSDVGGVLLNLKNATAVADGYARIMAAVTAAHPDAPIDGVHVQPMITEGQEVIVGMVRDPQFGPVMMFGSGGIEVEGLDDVDFALAPLLQTEAEEMLANTWAGRKLDGFRNIAAGDKTAVLDILIRLGQLAADFPQLAEIEINPVRVLPQGAFAVDARAMIQK